MREKDFYLSSPLVGVIHYWLFTATLQLRIVGMPSECGVTASAVAQASCNE